MLQTGRCYISLGCPQRALHIGEVFDASPLFLRMYGTEDCVAPEYHSATPTNNCKQNHTLYEDVKAMLENRASSAADSNIFSSNLASMRSVSSQVVYSSSSPMSSSLELELLMFLYLYLCSPMPAGCLVRLLVGVLTSQTHNNSNDTRTRAQRSKCHNEKCGNMFV